MFGKTWQKIRYHLKRSASITVGHMNTHRHSCVLLVVGRKRVPLSPTGARLVADQLKLWADHAEAQDFPMQVMRWHVVCTKIAKGEISAEISTQ